MRQQLGLGQALKLSLQAVLVGWAAGAFIAGFGFLFLFSFSAMTPFVVPVWLLLVVPHYLWVPREAVLWQKGCAPFYGLLMGIVALWCFHRIGFPNTMTVTPESLWNPVFIAGAAVTGMLTWSMGAYQLARLEVAEVRSARRL